MKNKKGSRCSRNEDAAPLKVVKVKQLPAEPEEICSASCEGEAGSGGAGGDRLSNLPHDILLNILERVDTLDALRTCILSKRMLMLPTMLSWFDINIGSLARHHDKAVGYTIIHQVRYNNAVAGVTEKILSARNPEISIRKLRVRFYLRRDECLSISKAVVRAMSTQKVDNAEFALVTEKPTQDCTEADFFCFAKQFNTCLCDCPAAFAGLTRLWLQNMRFDERDVPHILSTCKRLESLRLTYCDTGVRSVLQVEHSQLVELRIDNGKFEAIELNCLPNLQRVTYNSWVSYEDPLSFGSVPHLSKLSLANGVGSIKSFQLSQLLANVPSITDLHMDFKSEKIWVLPEHPKVLAPVLGKLQIVNLVNLPEGCDIAWTMFILEAAPSLKELCITVWDHFWCNVVTNHKKKLAYYGKAHMEWQPSALDFKHKNLVKLTIYGFHPDENFLRYVRRVLVVAVNMKEISLHDRKVCKGCGDLDPKITVCPSRYPRTSEEKDMLREEITKEIGMASTDVINFRS